MTTPTPGEREARLSLPFPPSVNNLFLNIPGRGRVRSPGYRKWANEAGWIIQLAKQPKLVGPVCVHLALKAPDKRRRDADNGWKAILDILAKHQVIEGDDSTIVRRIEAEWVDSGEPCVVTVKAA